MGNIQSPRLIGGGGNIYIYMYIYMYIHTIHLKYHEVLENIFLIFICHVDDPYCILKYCQMMLHRIPANDSTR